jgi:2,4-dienoyl-CoA reductase-like NADH-dependent reductase (Old Yellow Enzyme family)
MLFSPIDIRSLRLRNRIAVSPMCQYSAEEGLPNEWHLVHLGSRAVGGTALVIAEATAVTPDARISPGDLGIWSGRHAEAFRPIARFIKDNGAIPGIQIAHAGRKASTEVPWKGGAAIPREHGGWETVAPSPIPFRPGDPMPHALTPDEIVCVVTSFAAAAKRALDAGFELLEIHGAHGYLLNEFYSALANHRTDEYGGSFENRTRIVREVVEAVRKEWPSHLPLFLRISGTDWVDGGWTIDDSVELARMVKPLGVDLIDCSSGGIAPHVKIPLGPGYQVPIAERLRRDSGILTGAVGLITRPDQANAIIAEGQADLVLLAREMLRDPYWPLHAARDLGAELAPPVQYTRAF